MSITYKVFVFCILACLYSSCKGQTLDDIPQIKNSNASVYSARQVEVYNDVLNDLIKNHFYGYYLGDASDTLYAKNNKIRTDTSEINLDKRVLTLALLNDSSKLCTIYLNEDTIARKTFPWKVNMNTSYGQNIEKILTKYSENVSDVITQLSTRQSLYKSEDFYSSIAKIYSIHNMKKYDMDTRTIQGRKDKCVIGIASLSNIVLNKAKDKGIVYYEFYCGGRCGRGELAEIERINGKWRVVNTELFWVS